MTWLKFFCPCCTVKFQFISATLRYWPICGYCDCPLLRQDEQEDGEDDELEIFGRTGYEPDFSIG